MRRNLIKQFGISPPIIKAEYIAAFKTAQKILSLQRILLKLEIIKSIFPFPLLIDNNGATAVSKSEKVTCNICHIKICNHHVHNLAAKRVIKLLYTGSDLMTANNFTKPLINEKFREFRDLISIKEEPQTEWIRRNRVE